MTAIETRLIERLKQLLPGRVAEVVDFVEFLAAREERAAAAVRLGEAMSKLDALNLAPRRDLLPLGSYAGIPIVTAREATERIAG